MGLMHHTDTPPADSCNTRVTGLKRVDRSKTLNARGSMDANISTWLGVMLLMLVHKGLCLRYLFILKDFACAWWCVQCIGRRADASGSLGQVSAMPTTGEVGCD